MPYGVARMRFHSGLVCCLLLHLASAVEFGVGFGLSLDYGVASVYFENGSSVGIAKVEGGPDYKQMMHAQNWSAEFVPDDSPLLPIPTGFSMQSFRGRLPPWLGGPVPDPKVAIVARMLLALKTATEAYLGSKISDALVVFPVDPPRPLREALNSATHDLSLGMPVLLRAPAGMMAAYANEVGNGCDWTPGSEIKPDELVLTVEYSRTAMTVMLYHEDCQYLWPLRGKHSHSLGSGDWSAATRDLMVSELRNITHLPVTSTALSVEGQVFNQIDAIVLLGENGADGRLRGVIKELLEAAGHTLAVKTYLSDETSDMADPLFAAAIGTARSCLVRLENKERDLGMASLVYSGRGERYGFGWLVRWYEMLTRRIVSFDVCYI